MQAPVFTTTEIYPTVEPSSVITISTSSSVMPTGTLVVPGDMPILETTALTETIDETLQPTSQITLSTTSTETGPVGTIESLTTIEPTQTIVTINTEIYTTIPIQKNIVTPFPIAKATDSIAPTETKEPISTTLPPDLVLPTFAAAETATSSTPELTSTTPPTIVVFPVTEHIGIIEPTSTTDYAITSNSILQTTPVSFITTSDATTLDDSNASLVVSDATVTPFLPSNMSTVIVI